MAEAAGEAAPKPGCCTRICKYVTSSVTGFFGFFVVTPGKIGPPTCSNCAEKASVYSVDSKKSFCRFCTVLLHHPTTKNEKHSLEEIDFQRMPVKILSPILLDICLMFACTFLVTGPGITAEYFTGNSYCPALSRGRRWLARTDANIFFYYKAHLSTYCDWEDSYWRFFMDTWVRGILTDTDAFLLIMSQFVRAVIFEEFLRILVTPVVAVVYAIIATIVRLIEWQLSFLLSDAQKTAVNAVGKALTRFSFAASLAIQAKKTPPPPTLHRKRPMTDWVEGFKYQYDRKTRLISFYSAQAQSACRFVFRGSLKVALAMRIIMLLGDRSVLSWVQFAGLGDIGAKHMAWFAESAGMDLKSLEEGARFTDTSYSDWIAIKVFFQVLKQIPLVGWLGQEVGDTIVDGAWALWPVLRRAAPPLLCLAAPPYLWFRTIKQQKQKFTADWPKTSVDIFGPMTRDDPCVDWKTVCFSPPEASKAVTL